MQEPDRLDRMILSVLQREGRISNLELAERVGLSPTATSERMRRLVREGLVTGFGARLDPHRLGFGLLVFVEVLLDKTTPDVFDRFAAAVNRAPEVLECHMVAGGFDYLVKTRVRDMAAYRDFLGKVLLGLPGVRETRTYAVMEEVKTDGPLPLWVLRIPAGGAGRRRRGRRSLEQRHPVRWRWPWECPSSGCLQARDGLGRRNTRAAFRRTSPALASAEPASTRRMVRPVFRTTARASLPRHPARRIRRSWVPMVSRTAGCHGPSQWGPRHLPLRTIPPARSRRR
ncbi:Lrp/AsnC ligand binding domain-containing protein [Muricoccus vinaceus]